MEVGVSSWSIYTSKYTKLARVKKKDIRELDLNSVLRYGTVWCETEDKYGMAIFRVQQKI